MNEDVKNKLGGCKEDCQKCQQLDRDENECEAFDDMSDIHWDRDPGAQI